MTCTCGHQWCWLCRADWSTHGSHTGGYYSCNRYEKSDAKKVDDKVAASKKELDRYLHYYNRHFNYRRDLERGDAKRQHAAAKIAEFKRDVSATRFGMNSSFISEAVELELECRDVLSWTYVIAYFLEEGTRQSDFFGFLQANLEGITERLADLNKSKLADQDDDQLKTRTRVTKKYLDAMAQAMEEEARTLASRRASSSAAAPSASSH